MHFISINEKPSLQFASQATLPLSLAE